MCNGQSHSNRNILKDIKLFNFQMEEIIINEEELADDPSEKIPEESKIRRVMLFLIGIFLVLLMISYIFISFPISTIIEGMIESTPLQDNTLELDDITIIFDQNTHKLIQDYYQDEQKVEFSLCLQGIKEGTTYHIKSLYRPEQTQTFNQVSFQSCRDSIILFHTHPYKSCLASQTDLDTLKKSQEDNEDMLMIIMCTPKRFSVYR